MAHPVRVAIDLREEIDVPVRKAMIGVALGPNFRSCRLGPLDALIQLWAAKLGSESDDSAGGDDSLVSVPQAPMNMIKTTNGTARDVILIFIHSYSYLKELTQT